MANVVVLTHFVAAFSSSSDDQNCQDSDAILKLHRADSVFFFPCHVMVLLAKARVAARSSRLGRGEGF